MKLISISILSRCAIALAALLLTSNLSHAERRGHSINPNYAFTVRSYPPGSGSAGVRWVGGVWMLPPPRQTSLPWTAI